MLFSITNSWHSKFSIAFIRKKYIIDFKFHIVCCVIQKYDTKVSTMCFNWYSFLKWIKYEYFRKCENLCENLNVKFIHMFMPRSLLCPIAAILSKCIFISTVDCFILSIPFSEWKVSKTRLWIVNIRNSFLPRRKRGYFCNMQASFSKDLLENISCLREVHFRKPNRKNQEFGDVILPVQSSGRCHVERTWIFAINVA